MKYIKTYEQTNRGLVKELQNYLNSIQPKCGWCPLKIRFTEGVESVSQKINHIYGGTPSIIPNKEYDITLAMKEEVKGWFIISGEYLVNEEDEKIRLNLKGNIARYGQPVSYRRIIYTSYNFLQILKFANKEDIDKIKIEIDLNKYNL